MKQLKNQLRPFGDSVAEATRRVLEANFPYRSSNELKTRQRLDFSGAVLWTPPDWSAERSGIRIRGIDIVDGRWKHLRAQGYFRSQSLGINEIAMRSRGEMMFGLAGVGRMAGWSHIDCARARR